MKRIVRRDNKVLLRSENPAYPTHPAQPGDRVLALLRSLVRPEDLGPRRLASGRLEELFSWVDGPGEPGWARHGGHLFLLLDEEGQANSPTSVVMKVSSRWAAETAFVCHGGEGAWRYLGVARSDDGMTWSLPEMDYLAWSALRAAGTRRGLSRPLSTDAEAAAHRFVASMTIGSTRSRDGVSLTIVSVSARGGLRVCKPGMKERTVSLLDLAWVLYAQAHHQGVLDEAAVNRFRYIEGTPKVSTRWMDTGHALVLVLGESGSPDIM